MLWGKHDHCLPQMQGNNTVQPPPQIPDITFNWTFISQKHKGLLLVMKIKPERGEATEQELELCLGTPRALPTDALLKLG